MLFITKCCEVAAIEAYSEIYANQDFIQSLIGNLLISP